MNVVRDLALLPVWVHPDHLALTALHVMVGHKVKALAVVDNGALLGIATLEDLVTASPNAKVGEFVRAPGLVVEADSNVRDIAQQFVSLQADYAPVQHKGKFVGLLTPIMLLEELGRSYDPLTHLSWSDMLREWAVEHLKNGDEVTIIFIDLDHFGLYNKKYGHIIGDQVIQKVAAYLADSMDPELDVLVRYAGDEFAIGTLRDRDETEALAELLAKRFDGKMKGAEEAVSFSTGVFGGRRHQERENVHYAATVDNLINIASKNCIANKKRARGEQVEETKSALEQVAVLGIFADESVGSGVTTVILSSGGNVQSGADLRGEKTIVESIAAATVRALERSRPGLALQVVGIDLIQDKKTQVISVTGIVSAGDETHSVSSAKRVEGDMANAVAEATVQAFTR